MSEIRPRLRIPRLSEEEMREIVAKRLSRQVMFSDEVTPSSVRLVFLPLSMGALAPPEELRKALLGSVEPPDVLDDPSKPAPPEYPVAEDPPPKPTLAVVDPEIQRQFDWGDLEEEEYKLAQDAVEKVNAQLIQDWMQASLKWDESLDAHQAEVRRLNEEYEVALAEWEASLEGFDDQKDARDRWIAQHDTIFSEWGADVGVLMGDMDDSFPRGVNGYPMFHAMKVIHKDDWDRIRAAIIREQDREIAI